MAEDLKKKSGRQYVLTPNDVNVIHELRSKRGLSYRAISEMTGIDHVTVWRGFHFALPNGAPLDYHVMNKTPPGRLSTFTAMPPAPKKRGRPRKTL